MRQYETVRESSYFLIRFTTCYYMFYYILLHCLLRLLLFTTDYYVFENVGEGPEKVQRRLEKVGEGWRRLEKLGEGRESSLD